MKKFLCALFVLFCSNAAYGQGSGTVTNHAFAIGKGAGVSGYTSMLCTSAQLAVGQAAADPICRTVTGDWTISAAGVATLATVNANTGAFGSATQCLTVTYDAQGRATAVATATCTPAVGSITGFGAGIAAWLATPSGANLATALTTALPTTKGGTGDTGSAWAAFTPALTCGTATFTTTSARSKTMGKTTWIELDFTVTAIGTCANTITFNLPLTAQSAGALAGREAAINGKGWNCSFLAAATTGGCTHFDTSQILVNERVAISGVYENQ